MPFCTLTTASSFFKIPKGQAASETEGLPVRPFIDFYSVLEVHPSSSQETIRAAYRRLAKRVHPDVASTGRPTQKMQAINEAYSVLEDPLRRLDFDRIRDAILHSQQAGPRPASPSPEELPSAPSAQRSPPSKTAAPSQRTPSGAPPQEQAESEPDPFAVLSQIAARFLRAFLLRLWLWFLILAMLSVTLLAITEHPALVVAFYISNLILAVIDLLVPPSET